MYIYALLAGIFFYKTIKVKNLLLILGSRLWSCLPVSVRSHTANALVELLAYYQPVVQNCCSGRLRFLPGSSCTLLHVCRYFHGCCTGNDPVCSDHSSGCCFHRRSARSWVWSRCYPGSWPGNHLMVCGGESGGIKLQYSVCRPLLFGGIDVYWNRWWSHGSSWPLSWPLPSVWVHGLRVRKISGKTGSFVADFRFYIAFPRSFRRRKRLYPLSRSPWSST